MSTPSATNAYKYIRLEVFSLTENGNAVGFSEWQLAGVEVSDGETNCTVSLFQ